MKNFEHATARRLIWLVLFVLLPLGLAFNVNLVAPLLDSFHEGEYLGNLQVLDNYHRNLSAFPVLIHGAMDYLPSMVARAIAGTDHVIVWTRFLNVLAVAVCWLLYLDLSRVILREKVEKQVWGVLFFILFVWMAVAAGDDPVRKQQAFLGTRDIFLVLSLWCGARALYSGAKSATYAGLAGAGAFAAMSLYWSYDRGILAAVSIICFAGTLLYQKKWAYTSALVSAYVAALLLVSEWNGAGSLAGNVINITYWIKNTGDVWFIPMRGKLLALPGALVMALFALSVMAHAVLATIKRDPQRNLPLVLSLLMIQLVFLTKLYSLPGFPNSYYFIWPAFLLLILVPPESTVVSGVNNALARLFAHTSQPAGALARNDKSVLLGALLLGLMLGANAIVSTLQTAWQLARPAADLKLADSKRFGLDVIAPKSFDCIFQWSNEGVFALLSKKPYCTNYTYAVYISKGAEAAALNELKNNPPSLIVYGTPFWSMSIYGRNMRERLPAIDRFIQENYVFHDTGSGYVFATLNSKGLK